jgi:hypothetical protein
MDRREHHRAQLSLPARLRWSTPFGQKTEVCKTLDISRGGLLVPCKEAHAPGVPLWVTFPYDTSLLDAQPEILAKVVRVSDELSVALQFQPAFRAESNANGHAKETERRGSPRRPLAVPLRVRLEHVPWFEEAMTLDVSSQGLRFLSTREYSVGANVFVSFESLASAPWPAGTEILSRVVRLDPVPQSSSLAVTLARQS